VKERKRTSTEQVGTTFEPLPTRPTIMTERRPTIGKRGDKWYNANGHLSQMVSVGVRSC
jgi:hypothetical protein